MNMSSSEATCSRWWASGTTDGRRGSEFRCARTSGGAGVRRSGIARTALGMGDSAGAVEKAAQRKMARSRHFPWYACACRDIGGTRSKEKLGRRIESTHRVRTVHRNLIHLYLQACTYNLSVYGICQGTVIGQPWLGSQCHCLVESLVRALFRKWAAMTILGIESSGCGTCVKLNAWTVLSSKLTWEPGRKYSLRQE